MWTVEKIKQLINAEVEENLHLEYKGSGAISKTDEKKKEISKDISAFANSDGGTIIYGIREFDEKTKNHLPEKIDPVDSNVYSKEWLEQVINTTISPRIMNLIITPVRIQNEYENRVVFVIDIPKSNTAHQAHDKRYYKRFNFQSVIMDDWEIKDIINRQSKTDVEIEFESVLRNKILSKFFKSDRKVELKIWVKNIGNKVIKYLNCQMSWDFKTAKYIYEPDAEGKSEKLFSNSKERKIIIEGNQFVINTERIAILPSSYFKIGKLIIDKEFLNSDSSLIFNISTDDNLKQIEIKGRELYGKVKPSFIDLKYE